MPTKLKPCPFCGSGRVKVDDLDDELAHVHCDKCGADGPPRKSWVDASEAWNRRADARKGDGGRSQ